MNMGCISIYFCHLQLLSSISYTFWFIDFSHPWLNLFPSVLFFLMLLEMGSFKNFFSDSSLLVYGNATAFCILIMYPETTEFVYSNSFWMESLGFSIYKIMSSANRDNFTFSVLIWISFISFFPLISLARTSSTMLNSSGDSGYACFVSDLRGKAFNLSLLSVMFAVGLSYVKVCSIYTQFVEIC